ncbi:hypothetical protein CGH22_23980 [Vibrio parahaemolyticus]|uniref:hypothetical protein n=1 Tax=Vibrio parahaemolyticus TaxID=670 RepID=UPI00111CE218|nr:hypothetical protein [Vibrio parahaemolyticus]MBM4877275.1 hypothetical protein [Vibrio parahaemolyticus]TOH10739.1 hypothetical protein CGI90_19500 [Vibrio parahaemolyticus]TOP13541.1 hypothetical protein CGH22_23980 [Vibrio parahaemolyticus]TOQ54325.1 hypothetical protein CGG94_02265 [Vibrio parahaemolyticus]HCM1552167.1 hypothetical protein [Vibrio parahaemolyticus]
MSELCLKITIESCMDIQYISGITGKGIDMSKEKQLFQSALDVIIDGVAVSSVGEGREEAGRVLLEGVLPRFAHLVDDEKIKAIQSIIRMADEAESPTFKL